MKARRSYSILIALGLFACTTLEQRIISKMNGTKVFTYDDSKLVSASIVFVHQLQLK